jgi:hypothetical protein
MLSSHDLGRVHLQRPLKRKTSRRALVALATTVIALAGMTGSASAASNLDQSFTSPTNLTSSINECCAYVAQTFTAGRTGLLTGVAIDVRANDTTSLPLHVAIRTVDASGLPTSTVLGETVLNSGTSTLAQIIAFPQEIPITSGNQYAIVVNYQGAPPQGPGQGLGVWDGAIGDPYPPGALVLSFDYGVSWTNVSPGYDLHFQTYVVPSYYRLVTGDPTLLAYWRLGETTGSTAADTTGTYNGTYINKPTLGSPGAIVNDPNASVTFNGTSQRVNLPALPSATDFTIEGWTYLTNSSVNNNTLYGNIGTVRLLARPGTGTYRTAAYAGVTLNGTEYVLQPTSPASNINTWVYFVLTRQGGTMTLYRNGVQIAQRSDLPATATANLNGYIADQANGNYHLNGRVDDVAIYTSALPASTIAGHYQAALQGPAPS